MYIYNITLECDWNILIDNKINTNRLMYSRRVQVGHVASTVAQAAADQTSCRWW